MNLKKMSVSELVGLRDKIQTELARKIGQERDELNKQIAALTKLETGAAKAPKRSNAVVTRQAAKLGGGNPARRQAKRLRRNTAARGRNLDRTRALSTLAGGAGSHRQEA